ncbi:MAG: phosphatase PAP2 family protein [Bacteroidetes bacterium]|nr:MAG: phosphatase PAP2 family protein [Bacteroidota bacterium]
MSESFPFPSRALWALLLLHLLAWLPGGWYLWQAGYEGSFLSLNALRTPWLDALMPHLTHLGDGLLAGSVVALLLVRQQPARLLTILLAMLSIGVLVWLGKFVLFRDWHRPIIVFLHRQEFAYNALTQLFHHTFPSGHSAAAAGAATLLAAGRRQIGTGLLLGALALLAAYTRLYIGVHFLGDILAGSLLGVGVATAFSGVVHPRLQRWWTGWPDFTQSRAQRGLGLLALVLLIVSLLHLYWQYYR